nr:luminescent protein ReNL [synthetic construct]
MVSKGEEVIKEFMRFKVRMEGSMNGHEFEIEGEGEGRPYEGTQTAKLKVTKGGPLPFAWDILSPQFMYGSKAYVKHPADIPDYKKLSFPEGFKWERVMNFEDGGLVTVTQDSSLQDGTLIYKVKMRGTNFPPDGPVMQKKTMGWEASTERLYPRDGVLKGEIHQALKLKDGGHYLVEFKTIYMAKKPVQLPGYYYVDTKLDITSHNEDYTIVEQYERSEGRHHLFLGHGTGSTGSGSSGTASSEDNNMAVIKEFMRFKVRMEGSMNGHEFEIEGEGEGRPYEGTQTAKLKVTKGGPLPFAWDILSPQFMYGSKAYVKHPADIPDYKKLSFPEGFKWERVMNFEDGGLVTVTQDSSLQDGTLIYKVKMRGTNFPPDGPVMQKKTMGWEASTERLYPRDGVLKGEIHQALKLKDGGHYLVEFKTIYMAKKPVQLPGYYYVDTKLDITSHNEDYTIVEQYERSEGRHHLFRLEDFVGDWRQTAGYNLDQVLEQGGVSSLFQNLGVSVTPIQRIVLSGENGLKIDIHVIIPYEGLSGDQMGQIEKIFKVVYPVDDHHFKVILHYGTLVIDGVTPNMIDYFGRPYEGIAVFDGKKITVTGTLWNGNKIIDERLINPDGSLLFRVTINGVTGWRLCERILA